MLDTGLRCKVVLQNVDSLETKNTSKKLKQMTLIESVRVLVMG